MYIGNNIPILHKMIKRQLTQLLVEMAMKMPIISIMGPRQSGKTTLARSIFPNHHYINFELPENRLRAELDPLQLLKSYPQGLILDEVQRVPELFSFIQVVADEWRENGKFILTGSQNFLLNKQVSQSLAGRVFVSKLMPFSMKEVYLSGEATNNFDRFIFKGGYPAIFDRDIDPSLFFPSYQQTYLERDVLDMISLRNLSNFRRLIGLLAGRVGQLLNLSSLGTELGVDHKTVQSWIAALEASYVIFLLRPYHKNFSKRIIKSPKIYFWDTGLACNLLGIQNEKQVDTHWAKGSLFENLVIGEKAKSYLNQGKEPPLYFWRDSNGVEVDLIVESVEGLEVIEIKSGQTFHRSFLKNIELFGKNASAIQVNAQVIYSGNESWESGGVSIISWQKLIG